MTFRLCRRLSAGLFATSILTIAAAASAQMPARPAVTTQPAAELPPNSVTLPPNCLGTAAGPHDVDARLDGQPTRLHFDFRPPAGHAEHAPLVVSLSPELGTAPSAATLTPVCPAGHRWSDESVQTVLGQLIDGVVAEAGLDGDRVYLTGVGAAAGDTWEVGAALADRLAGVAPFEGQAPDDPAATVEALWHVGIYAVVPRADHPLPMVAALADRPHRDYAVHVDPAANAAAAARSAYGDPTFWGWMFAHHRSADTDAPPHRDPNPHLGPPTVFPKTTVPVAVSFDRHALPNHTGYAVIPATLHLGDKTLPFDFGLYLPPGYPHPVGYAGGPVATLVNLHWREFFGGSDDQVIHETLAKLLVRQPFEERHRGELPLHPVALTRVAPVICIMPHCPADCRFEWTPGMAEAIGQLIDQVVPALHADPDRVFLTGVSYGGSSSWIVGQQIADRLAGIIPCDGRRTADPAATAAALHDVGIYISAGDIDGDFTNDARLMSAALAAAGHPNVTYREIHGGNHFCFSATYTDPAFWSWLESQHRPPRSTGSTLTATSSSTAAPVILASLQVAAPATRPAAAAPKPMNGLAADRRPPAPSIQPTTQPAKLEAVVHAPPPPAPIRPTTQPAAVVAAAVKPAAPPVPALPPGPPTAFTVDVSTLPTTPGPHTVRTNIRMDGKPVRFKFWLYLPKDYGKAGQTWPVVMSLHNKGVIGGDGNGSITAEGLPLLLTHDRLDPRWTGNVAPHAIDLQHDAPFICVAPQVPTAHTFDDPAMLIVIDQLLESVVTHCHGDPTRTYLTGFSFGASNTWTVGAALPAHFAAIAPCDGRATADPDATVTQLAHTGVYQVVGGDDGDFLPEAKRMVAALAAKPHPDFAFHIVPGGNHFCYGSVYTDPTFWAWMFAHRRPAPAPKVVADDGNAEAGVTVLVDTSTLPRRGGYAVIRPTVRVNGEPLSVPVGIWLPTGYPHFAAPLPVILSLHNRYAIGKEDLNAALLGEGLPNILAYGDHNHGEHGDPPAHPLNPANDVAFMGVFPQCPAGHAWESGPMPEVVDKLLAALLAGYDSTVDPDRVYGTGWSYGASCTWNQAVAYPTRFAAIAINDGRAMPDPAAAVAKLKDVAVYLTVGDHDGVFIDEERRMLDALTASRHPNFVQHTIAHGDHEAYHAVYDDPAFWGWLLAQRRHAAAAAH
jgi:predicted peptidase